MIYRGLNFPTSILVARYLGKLQYGQYGVVQSTLVMLGTFAGLGLGLTAMKHVAEFQFLDPPKAGRLIGLLLISVFASGVTVFFLLQYAAPIVAHRILGSPELEMPLRIGSILLLTETLYGFLNGVLSGFERFRLIAVIAICTGLLSCMLRVAGAWHLGLPGTLLGQGVASIAGCALALFVVRLECSKRKIPLKNRIYLRDASILWNFSFPVLLSSVIANPVSWVLTVMLANKPHGFEGLAVWNAATQCCVPLSLLAVNASNALTPVLSERMAAADTPAIRRSFKTSTIFAAVTAFPLAIAVMLGSRYLMGMYGPSFTMGGRVLAIAAPTAALVAVLTPSAHLINASGRVWTGFLLNAFWGVVWLATASLFLRQNAGAEGLALGQLLAYLMHGALLFSFARRILRHNDGPTGTLNEAIREITPVTECLCPDPTRD